MYGTTFANGTVLMLILNKSIHTHNNGGIIHKQFPTPRSFRKGMSYVMAIEQEEMKETLLSR